MLDFEELDPFEAYALVEALVKSEGPNTFLLYTSPTYVALGKTTALTSVNVEECERNAIPIVRYMKGNWGPMFQHHDVLHPIIFYNIDEESYPANREDLFKIVLRIIVKTCEKFGLKAKRSTYRPRSNDILIGDKKVSGIAFFKKRDRIVFSTPLTLGFDYDLADKILNIPDSKFADKPYKTMREWVTSLRRELGREVSMEDVKTAFIKAFEEEHGTILEQGELTEAEKAIVKGLREKYTSESWIKWGKWSPVKEYWRPK